MNSRDGWIPLLKQLYISILVKMQSFPPKELYIKNGNEKLELIKNFILIFCFPVNH